MLHLTRLSVLRPKAAIALWTLLLVLAAGLATTAGGSYDDSFSLPDTESSRAQQVLQDEFPSSAEASATLVVGQFAQVEASPDQRAELDRLVDQIGKIPSVANVASPTGPQAEQQGLVSPDGTLGTARITFSGDFTEVPAADVQRLISLAERADDGDLTLGLSGQVLDLIQDPPTSEIIGIGVAVVVLLLLFGALVAAGLPILSAMLGLGVGLSLVTVAAKFLTIATFGPTLAVMIGLDDRFQGLVRRVALRNAWRVPRIGVGTRRRTGGSRGRRPGHPCDRTLCPCR